MFVLMTYDVQAKRTTKFRKLLSRFLRHQQFSVFYGDMTAAELVTLRKAVRELLAKDEEVLEICVEARGSALVTRHARQHASGPAASTRDTSHTQDYMVI